MDSSASHLGLTPHKRQREEYSYPQRNEVESEENAKKDSNETDPKISNLLVNSESKGEKGPEVENGQVNWVMSRRPLENSQSVRPSSPSSSTAASSLSSLHSDSYSNSNSQPVSNFASPQWNFRNSPSPNNYNSGPLPFNPSSPSSSLPIRPMNSAYPMPQSPSGSYLSYANPPHPFAYNPQPYNGYPNSFVAPPSSYPPPAYYFAPQNPPQTQNAAPKNSNVQTLPANSPLAALLTAAVDRSEVDHMRRMPANGMENNFGFPSMFAQNPPMNAAGYSMPSMPSPYFPPPSSNFPPSSMRNSMENSAVNNPPKGNLQMQIESLSKKDKKISKNSHYKPSRKSETLEAPLPEENYEETKNQNALRLCKGSKFRLLEEPDEMQRKSYKKENRCLHPNPLVICKRDGKDNQKLVDGVVTVRLVDENGMDLPPTKSACLESIDGGLTHPLDEDASTVFSLKILQTSQGQLFRLLFCISYRVKGQPNVEEKIFSEPFGVYSNKYDRDSRRKRLKTFVYYRAGMAAPGQTSPTHV